MSSNSSSNKDPFKNADYKKKDLKMVDDAANEARVDRNAFGEYIYEIKVDLGMKANQNFTYQELVKLAEELKAILNSIK